MKRTLTLAALAFVATLVFAQHESGHKAAEPAESHESGGHGGGSMTGWKWANFALLAGGLGYLIAKKAPEFFRGRTSEIQKGITEAARLKADADARAAEIERRIANLGAEVEALRAGAREEMDAETERLRAETAQQFAKIRAQAEQEIASASKAARTDLKAYAAELAIGLAEQQLRVRMTAQAERGLVAGFVKDLENQADAGQGVN